MVEVIHLDALGRPLKVGDAVACPKGISSLMIGRIVSLGRKQVRVVSYGESDKVLNWKGEMTQNGKL